MSLEAATTQLRANENRARSGTIWYDAKSKRAYAVKCHILIEQTLEPAVVYREYSQGDVDWCRPATEFFDGRFVRIGLQRANG